MDTNLGITTLRSTDSTAAGKTKPTASNAGTTDSGNGLPQSARKSTDAKSKNELNDAVQRLRDQAQDEHRNLEFSVDEGSGETVVKVVQADTGEVIRQIPSEVALKLAESLKESSNLLFSERA
ncbi:MAG: hypothetical protein GAK43_01549 [Stenotrophomonas maltophilia]|nr:MAG: hypothetical protein GAK43_01549 [Stenotrophomonas maltophilia]